MNYIWKWVKRKIARIRDEVLDYTPKSVVNGVLVNKLNIKDSEELERVEREITALKLAKLYLNPGKQTFDVEHYLSIHKFLFEDIYDFAGEIRDEVIAKQIPFCLPQFIYDNLNQTLRDAQKNISKITDRTKLVQFLAVLYSDLDKTHPFREGNGRVEREFLRQYVIEICKRNNLEEYVLDYSLIEDKEAFIQAVIVADTACNTTYLEQFIDKILVSAQKNKKHPR